MEQNTMNAQNAMNTENTQTAATKVERFFPTPEIIERNDFLTDLIDDLVNVHLDPDLDEINAYLGEQQDIHSKYSFFDEVFEENGLKGVKDIKGNIRVPAIYTDIYGLYDYMNMYSPEMKNLPICAYDQNHKCALVRPDGKGTPLTPFIYDAIVKDRFVHEFTIIQGEKKGTMNKKGNILVPCEMDDVYEYFNSIRVLEAGGKYGLTTDWGLYIAPVYDEIDDKNDYVYVRLGDTWGYLDHSGKFIDESDDETVETTHLLNFEPEF